MIFRNSSSRIFLSFCFISYSFSLMMSLVHLLSRPELFPPRSLVNPTGNSVHFLNWSQKANGIQLQSLKSHRISTAGLMVHVRWRGWRQSTHVYSSRGVTETCLGCHRHAWGTVVLLAVRLCISGHSEEIPLFSMQSAAEQSLRVIQGSGQRQGNTLALITSGA